MPETVFFFWLCAVSSAAFYSFVPGMSAVHSCFHHPTAHIRSPAKELGLDADTIRSKLRDGHPIICIMGPGDFTSTGHFIVLTGVKSNGDVTVNDPNSRKNSDKSWDLEEIMSQMRNLWVYSKA